MDDRKSLVELLAALGGCCLDVEEDVEHVADYLIAHGVTVRKHGRCDMCSIGTTGTGSIGLYGHGWQVCIRRQAWTYDLVINHCGEQIAIPIDWCHECGAKLEKEAIT